jgi:hypothetical protein
MKTEAMVVISLKHERELLVPRRNSRRLERQPL